LAFDLSVTIRRPPAALLTLLADVQGNVPQRAGIQMTKISAGPHASSRKRTKGALAASH